MWFWLKATHVLFAMLYLGTGLGSAYYKLRAYASRDPQIIAFCDREIVRADWIFTVSSGVVMPVTGLAMVSLLQLPWKTSWLVAAFALYVLAGLLWLWAAALQLRMRRLSQLAAEAGQPVDSAYHRAHRQWLLLGFPAFVAAVATVVLMVVKPMLW